MLTVFTPTYNRGYIIENLYRSLKEQTDFNFEWIVIDDGSTDNTKSLFEKWIKETTEFEIRYRLVPHAGLCPAMNIAAEMARSEAFIYVDSDDRLLPDAIEFIQVHFREVADDASFAGMCGLTRYISNGEIIGGAPDFIGYVDCLIWDRERYGLRGDCLWIYKTSVRRQYPNVVFEGEYHSYLGIAENEMTHDGLRIRWYDKILSEKQYREDGITQNASANTKSNPRGSAYYTTQQYRYGLVPAEWAYRSLFGLYVLKIYTVEEMQKLFSLSDRNVNELSKVYQKVIAELTAILLEHKIKTMALYGYGSNAKCLMSYLSKMNTDVKIKYVIDQDYQNKDYYPAYSLDMNLPDVDSICITILDPIPEVECVLRKKFRDAYIWKLAELETKAW